MVQDIMFVAQKNFHKNVKKEQIKSAPHYYLLKLLTIQKEVEIKRFGKWRRSFAQVHCQTAPRYQLEKLAQFGETAQFGGMQFGSGYCSVFLRNADLHNF